MVFFFCFFCGPISKTWPTLANTSSCHIGRKWIPLYVLCTVLKNWVDCPLTSLSLSLSLSPYKIFFRWILFAGGLESWSRNILNFRLFYLVVMFTFFIQVLCWRKMFIWSNSVFKECWCKYSVSKSMSSAAPVGIFRLEFFLLIILNLVRA